MAIIIRLFATFFGFLAACLVASVVILFALLFPEMQTQTIEVNEDTLNVIVGFGFLLFSGFALVPALIVILITEVFSIRSFLIYALLGGVAGLGAYLAFVPFDTATMMFDGIDQRHLQIMAGAGILGGMVYWMIAGHSAGRWRRTAAPDAR